MSKESGSGVKFVFFVVIVLAAVFNPLSAKYIFNGFHGNNSQLIEPSVTPTLSALGKVVQNSLSDDQGDYAVVIKNLKTGETYSLNEHKKYQPGSLYKLWVMADAYERIDSGELKEDEELSGDVATLNRAFNISDEDADLTQGEVDLTVKSALNQMITISHNYAALLLTDRLHLSSVANFLSQKGFADSSVSANSDPPLTSASDIALFFEKLNHGDLASPKSTAEMLELLKNQKLNDKLPRLLPAATVIAHKTGEIDTFSHDAGIVYSPSGDYIIVVLSNNEDVEGSNTKIAELSKAVYDYFSGS